MKKTLTLRNPIKINGKSVGKLTHDANEITAQMFAEADASKMKASGSTGGNLSGAVELDYGLHLYLGFMAIKAVNPEYDLADLERIHGYDVMEVMKIGRNFITSRQVEGSNPDSSDEQSETTPEPLAPPSETSENEG
jgi:hypothetical protein